MDRTQGFRALWVVVFFACFTTGGHAAICKRKHGALIFRENGCKPREVQIDGLLVGQQGAQGPNGPPGPSGSSRVSVKQGSATTIGTSGDPGSGGVSMVLGPGSYLVTAALELATGAAEAFGVACEIELSEVDVCSCPVSRVKRLITLGGPRPNASVKLQTALQLESNTGISAGCRLKTETAFDCAPMHDCPAWNVEGDVVALQVDSIDSGISVDGNGCGLFCHVDPD